ncbi:ribose-phosphate diphosphokinase [Candidatus Woesearchaeota archaeon]|nr:ribose-phosphate diphosphokinase [Candidatus Woesearchaeota archaeon]
MVIVSGRSADKFASVLMKKFHERADKEFHDINEKNKQLLQHIKKKNLILADKIIKQHNDGELFVQLKTNIRNKDVHVIQTFADKNRDLMELFIINDALNRAGANSITNYLLYVPYQRQDKKDDGRVAISAKLIFNLLKESCGIGKLKRIVTFDLHARQAQAHFDGPVDEIRAMPLFASYYRDILKAQLAQKDKELVAVISPDAGSAKRAEYLARLLGVRYHVLDKKRTSHGETAFNFVLDWDCKGKHVIMCDDMIDTGGSMVAPINFLKSRGAIVYACCTHPLLSPKAGMSTEQKLAPTGVHLLTTDSLPEKHKGYFKEHSRWVDVISLAFDMAKVMYCNQIGDSVSLFIDKTEKLIAKEALDINIYDVEGEDVKQIDLNGL